MNVLVVAAYPAVRAGLRAMLAGAGGISVVGEVPDLADIGAVEDAVDLAVIDLDESLLAQGSVAALLPDLPAVFLAADEEDYVGLRNGAAQSPRAFLLREAAAEEIVAAVQAVAHGLVVLAPAVARALTTARNEPVHATPVADIEPLTEREQEVLRLLALGLPNKGIALRLRISEHTVKFHVGSILAKLGAAGRTEAVMLAARIGLLPL
jgi:DNA-binding NarL/FixJ family response regulator